MKFVLNRIHMQTAIILFLITITGICSGQASASSPVITNTEYKEYISKSPEFSDAEKELNDIYKQLSAVLDASSKEQLKQEQRAWIKTRDEQAFNVAEKGSTGYIAHLTRLSTERSQSQSSLKFEVAPLSWFTRRPFPPVSCPRFSGLS